MSEYVGSDYWCMYNECSQGAQLNLWSDPWPSDVTSCEPGALPPLFDELSRYEELLSLVNETDVFPEKLVDIRADSIETEFGVTEAVVSLASASAPASEDVCLRAFGNLFAVSIDEPASTRSAIDGTREHIDSMSPRLQNEMSHSPLSEVEDEHGSRHSDSNSSDQSSSVEPESSYDRNNNGWEQNLIAGRSKRGFPGSPRMNLPKRVSARRTEVCINDCSDDSEEEQTCNSFRAKRRTLPEDEVTSSHGGRLAFSDLNKNALNARLNRQKKKAYITSLETRQSQLRAENSRLKSFVTGLVSERDRLVDEVDYLRSVLTNDSALAQLIGSIRGSKDVSLSSRFETSGRKRQQSVEVDHNYAPVSKTSKVDSYRSGGGICLHVQQNKLSLEFCEQCARMSGSVL